MDQRVLAAVRRDGEPAGVELLAGLDRADLLAELGRQPVRDRTRCEQRQPRVGLQRGADLVRVDVIGVLVRDQDRAGAVECLLDLAERAGIDDQAAVTVVEPDARVRELGQLHQMSRSSSTTCIAASSALLA